MPRKRKRTVENPIPCVSCMYEFVLNKPKSSLLIIVCLVITCQFVYVLISIFGDDGCLGVQYQQFLCDKFKEGEIVGSLCEQLCSYRIKLSTCVEGGGDIQVFYTWSKLLKVSKKDYLTVVSGGLIGRDSLFFEPLESSSLDDFYTSLQLLLESRLGPGNHGNLITRVTQIVDHNRDGILSLAESKTIWSLLQSPEFFVLAIFHKEFNVAQVTGYCGNLYAVDHPHTQYLYKKSNNFIKTVFPNSYTWLFPYWERRAKLAYSLVELMYNLYEDSYAGVFYVCNWDEENIGYSAVYEAQVTDYSFVIPRYSLSVIQRSKTCRSSLECSYGKYCQTTCNTTAQRCTGELEKSMFSPLCSVLRIYLLKNVPDKLRERLERLLTKCMSLGGDDAVQQSLFVNEILSTLWPQILQLKS